GDQVALDRERLEQLRRGVRLDDRKRVGVEREDRVVAADHLAVPQVDAVERADGDAARAGLRVGQAGDFHLNTTIGLSSPSPGSAMAIRRPSCISRVWGVGCGVW